MRIGKPDIESSDGGYLIFLIKISWNFKADEGLAWYGHCGRGMEIVI